jgi:putative FmdB family regulatory protein
VPIYEYECLSCGKNFEIIQKITEEPISTCPSCAGKVRKLISNCSFQLKGTGWYVTDYARKPDKKEDKKEAKADKSKEKGESICNAKDTPPKKAINE